MERRRGLSKLLNKHSKGTRHTNYQHAHYYWGSSLGAVLEMESCTRLDLMRPSVGDYVVAKQLEQKQHHDRHSKSEFCVEQAVFAHNAWEEP